MLGSFTFAFLCSSIALVGTLSTWLWIVIAGTFVRFEGGLHRSWDMWSTVRLLDIAVGAGIVNSILSPLSVSFAMYFFSVYVYEPRWRSHVVRCIHLMHPEAQVEEVAALLDGDEPGESEGGRWVLEGVQTARGKPVKLPYQTGEDSSDGEEDEEGTPCIGHDSSLSGASGRSLRSLRLASSLAGVAKAQPRRCQPLIVNLRRKDATSCASRMVCFFDYILSVDSKLPVMQRSSKELMEKAWEEDEDDCESSESDGSFVSASESSGRSSGTGTDSSGEILSRPSRASWS